ALGRVREAPEAGGHTRDGFLVALLRELHAVAMLRLGLDNPVDELPRLPVRIRRARHALSVDQARDGRPRAPRTRRTSTAAKAFVPPGRCAAGPRLPAPASASGRRRRASPRCPSPARTCSCT